MPRHRKPVQITLDPQVYNALSQAADRLHMSISRLVEAMAREKLAISNDLGDLQALMNEDGDTP